jgi:hypothetical protein
VVWNTNPNKHIQVVWNTNPNKHIQVLKQLEESKENSTQFATMKGSTSNFLTQALISPSSKQLASFGRQKMCTLLLT